MTFIGSFDKGSFSSRLANQMGEGLQRGVDTQKDVFIDQYKKSFERNRLANDLERLNQDMKQSQEQGKPLSPLEYNQRLASMGLDSQSFSTLSEMYNQNLRDNYYRNSSTSDVTDGVQISDLDIDESPETIENRSSLPSASVSAKRKTKKPTPQNYANNYDYIDKNGSIKPYVSPSPEERRSGIGRLANENNLTVVQAEKLYDDIQNQVKTTTSDLETNTDKLREKYETKLKNKLEREGLKEVYRDISGDIIERKFQQVRSNWINSQGDIEQLAESATNDILDLVKKKNDFTRGMIRPSLLRDKSQTNRLRSEISKDYKKLGARDELAREYIKETGVNAPVAYTWAYDGVGNKEIEKLIKNNQGSSWRGGISSKNIAEKIIPLITPDTSLMAISNALLNANYDPEQFLDSVRNNQELRAQLSTAQNNEISAPTTEDFLSPLYSWWYEL